MMEKKEYTKPIADIIEFTGDIIITSGGTGADDFEDGGHYGREDLWN